MNYRASENTEHVEIDEIDNNDYVWTQGYLFKVSDLEFYEDKGQKVMRYTGIVVDDVDGNERIKNTAFNGGRYGHNNTIKALRVKRSLNPHFQ